MLDKLKDNRLLQSFLQGGGGAGAVGGGEDGSGPGGDLRRSQEPAQQVAEAPGLRRRARRQQGAP